MSGKIYDDEIYEAIDKLCLFDDDFMSVVFERNFEATEYVINTILERNDLKVIEVVGQKEFQSPYVDGRSITIDIYAKDSAGKEYDIEVQRQDTGANPERARFHSAMLDVRMLKESQKFHEIKNSYVIFITQNDVMKKSLPLYHIERTIKETGDNFGDGAHIIYVNGSYKDTTSEIGRLMHDFNCTHSSDMYSAVLKKQVSYFKETTGGKEDMCEIIQNVAERVANRREERNNIEHIRALVTKLNYTLDKALEFLDIPQEQWDYYKKLISENS